MADEGVQRGRPSGEIDFIGTVQIICARMTSLSCRDTVVFGKIRPVRSGSTLTEIHQRSENVVECFQNVFNFFDPLGVLENA